MESQTIRICHMIKLWQAGDSILSVLTLTGKSDKLQDAILYDTKNQLVFHLEGGESTAKRMRTGAYPALIRHLENDFQPRSNMEHRVFPRHFFRALKYYAWKYF